MYIATNNGARKSTRSMRESEEKMGDKKIPPLFLAQLLVRL